MVVAEIIATIVEFAAEHLGVAGPMVGLSAVALIVLFYGHELADVMTRLGRAMRIAVFVAASVFGVLLVGLFTGVLSLDGGIGAVVALLADLVNGVIHS